MTRDGSFLIENGKIVIEQNAGDLAGNDHIRRSYLGI